jgi:hypothetical protein
MKVKEEKGENLFEGDERGLKKLMPHTSFGRTPLHQ